MTEQQHYNLEKLIHQLITNRAGLHNSKAELTDKEGNSKGIVIVDLQYNKESRAHLLQVIAPAEINDKHRGMATYSARFMIRMDKVDVEALVKNVRTTADALLQLVGLLERTPYVDFSEIDKEAEKLREEQLERQRKQLASRAMREGSRGVTG